jgi:hypothetical protein
VKREIRTLSVLLVAALFAVGIGLAGAPVAAADPTDDGYDNIFGLITPDEQQEISANGQRNCVTLDQAFENGPPLGSQDVIALIETYRAQGWDLESASDIVWESVEGRCPEYLDAVKRAVRTYGDPS